MSIAAMLIAARDALRAVDGFSNERCDIQPGGRPPARMGEFYIALDEGSIQSTEKSSLREVFTIVVWISKRTGKYPRDQYGKIYTANAIGMDAIERKVIRAIHGQQAVRVAANTLLGAPHANAGDIFQQPLWYTGRGPTQFRGADWSGGSDESDTFLVRQLTFAGAVRVQALDIMH